MVKIHIKVQLIMHQQKFDGAMNTFEILNGKELSYNNIKDVDIAWKCVSEFEETACCALKHNTPCGVAIGKNAL